MSENKRTVDRYMDAFRRMDTETVAACLTDDVRWELPGVYDLAGKDAFLREMHNSDFEGKPAITVTRTIEEGDVVVTEGTVETRRRDGVTMRLVFCDVFEMREAKIARLISYLMEVK